MDVIMRQAAIVIGAAGLASAVAYLRVRRADGKHDRSRMEFTVMLSFKRDGEIFGTRITCESTAVSFGERGLYYDALMRAIALFAAAALAEPR